MHEEATTFPGGVHAVTGELIQAPELERISKSGSKLCSPEPGRRRGLRDGIDPADLAQTGWGILFAASDKRAKRILQALEPLVKRRKKQARGRYKEYLGADGYQDREHKLAFLDNRGAGPGRVDPSKVPYYLLLVGSPEQIPYRFQYELDQQHAVGRIWFRTLKEYEAYARAVVAAEKARQRSRKTVGFFGPLQDDGTRLTNDSLLFPLIQDLGKEAECKLLLGQAATKPALSRLLHGRERPDLLFTAGHGVLYDCGDAGQKKRQGALVCQEWPGPGHPPEPAHYFAAEDVNGARLRGLLAFFFACNSAGTPDLGDFAPEDGNGWQASPAPFVSSLACRLLASGALAVVGHVERVWRCSFFWRETGSQPQPFVETLRRLLEGKPLGWAMEPLGDRFADLAVCLGTLLQERYQGLPVDEELLKELWIACNDARNYVIVGDPAVRLIPAEPVPPPAPTRTRRG